MTNCSKQIVCLQPHHAHRGRAALGHETGRWTEGKFENL